MDIMNLGFIGLMTVGLVNVLTFFFPTMNEKVKFGSSVVFAFLLTFVPAEIANMVLNNAKIALEAAFAASGAYKIAQKAGGS